MTTSSTPKEGLTPETELAKDNFRNPKDNIKLILTSALTLQEFSRRDLINHSGVAASTAARLFNAYIKEHCENNTDKQARAGRPSHIFQLTESGRIALNKMAERYGLNIARPSKPEPSFATQLSESERRQAWWHATSTHAQIKDIANERRSILNSLPAQSTEQQNAIKSKANTLEKKIIKLLQRAAKEAIKAGAHDWSINDRRPFATFLNEADISDINFLFAEIN